MEIHSYERLWIGVSLLLIVGFIGTVTYGSLGPGVQMVGERGGTIANPGNPADSPNFREPGVYPVEGEPNHYDAYVVARQFLFEPGTTQPIEVPAGSTVTLHVTSVDVVHGFEVVGTNVNAMAIPGQVASMTVRFREEAEYGIVCNEYCGPGHHTMEGRIHVVPPSEFEASGTGGA